MLNFEQSNLNQNQNQDQNGRPLEIEDKVNLTLLINKQKWRDILQNQEQKNILDDMDFLSFVRKYEKQLLNTGLEFLKTASRKLVHKTCAFIGNKTADVVTNSYDGKIMKVEPVEEVIIPAVKGEEILNKLRQVL